MTAAGPVAGVHGEVEVGGGGQDDLAEDGVVGEPGVGARRQPPGEQQFLRARPGDLGFEERVAGRVGPGGRGERHGGEPVALPLEGVGGQRHGAGAGQQRRPVGVDAVGEEGGDGGEQPVPFGPVAQDGGGEHGFLVLVYAAVAAVVPLSAGAVPVRAVSARAVSRLSGPTSRKRRAPRARRRSRAS
ncbi:hypothetical protein STENM223S_04230 [Streptomyces tendae]